MFAISISLEIGLTLIISLRVDLGCFFIMYLYILVAACIQEGTDNLTFLPDNLLHSFDDILTYTCNTGYNHSTGDLLRHCQSNGEWTGEHPTCPSKNSLPGPKVIKLVSCSTEHEISTAHNNLNVDK